MHGTGLLTRALATLAASAVLGTGSLASALPADASSIAPATTVGTAAALPTDHWPTWPDPDDWPDDWEWDDDWDDDDDGGGNDGGGNDGGGNGGGGNGGGGNGGGGNDDNKDEDSDGGGNGGNGGGTPDPAPTTPRQALTRQVSANVAYSLSGARQRADVQTAARRADVIGWQEISTRSQARAIQSLPGFATYWPGGRRRDGEVSLESINASPISWRTSMWRRVGAGRQLSSLAIPGVCRDRYLSWVVLKHRRSGIRVLRWNIHFVPAAWVDRRVSFKSMRQAAWNRQARTVAALVDRSRGKGYAAIVGGGDINRRHAFLGDRVVYDTQHERIDYLTHVPSRRVVASRPVYAEMNSDHDKVTVSYAIHRWR